jgi:hypothetical protein
MDLDKKLDRLLLYAAVIIVVGGFVSQLSIAGQRPLLSDNVQQSMYRADMATHHNYLLKDWYVPENSYLLTEFPFYFIVESLCGPSLFSIKASEFIILSGAALILSLLLYRVFGKNAALMGGASLLGGSLFCSTVVFYTPMSHFGTMIFSLLCFLAFVEILKRPPAAGPGAKGIPWTLALYGAIALLSTCAMFSDKLFLTVFVVPLLFTLIVIRVLGLFPGSEKKAYIISLVILGAVIAGAALMRAALSSGLHLMPVKFVIADFPKLLDNIGIYLQCLTKILSLDFLTQGQPVACVLIKGLHVAMVALAILWSARLFERDKDPVKRLTIMFFVNASLFLSMAFLLSGFPSSSDSARYLVSLPFTYALFIALALSRGREIARTGGYLFVIVTFLLVSFCNIYQGITYRSAQPHMALSKFLESQNLHYGFSSYWYSNILTFLSHDSVKVRALKINRGALKPCLWICKSDWYAPQAYDGPTFLIVPRKADIASHAGIADLQEDYLWSQLGKPAQKKTFEDLDIFIWPFNVMASMGNIEASQFFHVTGNTYHEIGNVESLEERHILHSRKGEKGVLLGRICAMLKAGSYTLKTYSMAQGEDDETAATAGVYLVDMRNNAVAGRFETEIKAHRKAQWDESVLNFDVDRKSVDTIGYEIKILSTGKADISIKGACLLKLQK